MIGEGKFVQVAGSGGIEIFFVGKKVPWWIILNISETRRDFRRSIKVRNLEFFHNLFYILTSSWKTKSLIKLYNSLKSLLKNLSNEYIHAEQNTNRIRDIGFQSWPFHRSKRKNIFFKFLTIDERIFFNLCFDWKVLWCGFFLIRVP
jgi:hypothetical protein